MARYRYPTDKVTGSIPSYAHDDVGSMYLWQDPAPIRIAALAFVRFERGRSAAHAVFGDGASRFSMFLTDLGDLLRSGEMDGALWRPSCQHVMPCKRGSNFGIRPLNADEARAMIGATT